VGKGASHVHHLSTRKPQRRAHHWTAIFKVVGTLL